MTLPEVSPLDRITQRYSRLEAVYQLTRRLAAATSEAEVGRIAIESLLEIVPGQRASMLLVANDGVMRFCAWHGLSDAYRAGVEGHSPWKAGTAHAKPLLVTDVRTDVNMLPLLPVLEAEQVRSAAFVPLLGRAGVIGKFMVYGREPGDPLQGEVELAMSIADHAAIVVERLRTEAQLRRERAMFDDGPVVLFRWGARTGARPQYVSPNISQFGYRSQDLLDGTVDLASRIHPDDLARARDEMRAMTAAGVRAFEQVYRMQTATGEWRQVFDHTAIERDQLGAVRHYEGYILDITDQRRLEHDLLQAQKVETVGRLAGGVAHDFNNLLTIILGSAEQALAASPPGSEVARAAASISHAAARAAELTSQLLAFARRQVIAPRNVDLNELLQNLSELLRRALGERIALVLELHDPEACVRMDPGQLQQVLVNLALNARDAMPQGGTLTIRTGEEHQVPFARSPRMVALSVSDTGCGMSPETLEHLFEPFFTTKEVGKGTGLGLASCYGIVKQNGGSITVTSELGRGSRFHVRLPRVLTAAEASAPAAPPSAAPGDRVASCILLVEDDVLVRDFVRMVLERAGHRVRAVSDGVEALALAETSSEPFGLLVSDVVMPRMGGRELADRIRRRWPELRVLLMSGHEPEADGPGWGSDLPVLSKPFSAAQLLHEVDQLLAVTRA